MAPEVSRVTIHRALPFLPLFLAVLFRSLSVCDADVGFGEWGLDAQAHVAVGPGSLAIQTPQSRDLCAREPA